MSVVFAERAESGSGTTTAGELTFPVTLGLGAHAPVKGDTLICAVLFEVGWSDGNIYPVTRDFTDPSGNIWVNTETARYTPPSGTPIPDGNDYYLALYVCQFNGSPLDVITCEFSGLPTGGSIISSYAFQFYYFGFHLASHGFVYNSTIIPDGEDTDAPAQAQVPITPNQLLCAFFWNNINEQMGTPTVQSGWTVLYDDTPNGVSFFAQYIVRPNQNQSIPNIVSENSVSPWIMNTALIQIGPPSGVQTQICFPNELQDIAIED